MKMEMKMLKKMKMKMKTMYLDAVRGRLMALKRRSETAKLILTLYFQNSFGETRYKNRARIKNTHEHDH